jgi:hypothetical protein
MQFETAFREAFASTVPPRAVALEIQRAEPLVAVAERTMVESVLDRRRTSFVPASVVPPLQPIEAPRVESAYETFVSIPVVREPVIREPARARARPRPRAPRLVPIRRRPLYNAWRQTARWFRRIPASTYIVSFAAVMVAAAFVGITVRARQTFQLTARQPH